MARILVSGNLVRFPMGGASQYYTSFLVGLRQLGHDVYFVEKARWPAACYDVPKRENTDDCSYGLGVMQALLARYDFADRWCYVEFNGRYHGLDQGRVQELFSTADAFIELDGSGWENESGSTLRVLIEGEPGWQQMKMENSLRAGEPIPEFDRYYTTGHNVGTEWSASPTAAKTWGKIFCPIRVDAVPFEPPTGDGPFSSVMRWRTNKPVTFDGTTYGQKDLEFSKFMTLPSLVSVPLEVAVSGRVPRETLELMRSSGWGVRDAEQVSVSIDSYWDYIRRSRGDFAVCKNVFVANNTGVFIDRPGWYMASGRPAVVQDTGFSRHLPCGRGLFAVRTVEEAADAIETIASDYLTHARAAREIAAEYLDARKVLAKFLAEIGLS